MNMKNVCQEKHSFSSVERQGFPTKVKMKAVVCEKHLDKTILNASTTGSSERLTDMIESKKINTNMNVANKIPLSCKNQKIPNSEQKKAIRGGLPNFFKPTKCYMSSLTEKKKIQKSLSQNRLVEKSIKNRLPLKKKSLSVVVSDINSSQCKSTCLSKIDTEENPHGQRTFIRQKLNTAGDSQVCPIKSITKINLNQRIRSKNSKEIKSNQKKSFSKKPPELCKDRINDHSNRENRKCLKKNPYLLSDSKNGAALPKKILVKAPVSASVVSINVSQRVQVKQNCVPCCVLKKKNKLGFVSSVAKNLQKDVECVLYSHLKKDIKNVNQYSTFSKSCREKKIYRSQNASQLKKPPVFCKTVQPVNCCTRESSEETSTFQTKLMKPSCNALPVVEECTAWETTDMRPRREKNEFQEEKKSERSDPCNFCCVENCSGLHNPELSNLPIVETSEVNLGECQVVTTGKNTRTCSQNDSNSEKDLNNHMMMNCLKSNINKSRLRLLSEMLNSQDNLPLYDSHRHLGEWMILVDLAVTEKVCEKEKSKDEEPISVALQSLGSLSLLAAGAADVTCSSHLSTSQIPMSNLEFKNLSFQDFSTGSRQELRPYSPRFFQASRSLSPQQSCCTPIRRSLSGNEFSILKFGDRDVELCIDSKRASRLHSTIISPYETPVPQVIEKEKSVDAALYRDVHDANNNLDLSRLSVISSEFSSTVLRAPRRNVAHARSRLLRAIGCRNAEEVKNVITLYGIDPNDYITVPTTHIPWIAAAPTLWLENLNKSTENFRSTLRVANCRLHLLHIAAVISSQKVVQVLVNMGSCVNALDEWCRNPLHCLLQPPPMAFLLKPLLLENKNDTLSWDEQKLVNQLFMFLLKQTMTRSTVETKIAEVFCQGGINIHFKEKWNHSCLDYAKIWVRIRHLIQSNALQKFFQTRQNKKRVHNNESSCDTEEKELGKESGVITVAPQVTLTFSSLQKHLLSRIPEALLDVVFLHEDRLRLKALSSIVGVRVGGSKSAQETVYINLIKKSQKTSVSKESQERPFTNYFTPKREGVSRCNSQNNKDLTDKVFLLDANKQLDSASRTKEFFCDNPHLATRSSVILSHLHCIPPTPNSGHVQTCKSYNTPTGLRLSCLRALEKNRNSVDKEIKLQEGCNTINTIQDDDLVEFLRLLSAPAYRFHPAFSGVWEFLGATVFPQEEKEFSSPFIEYKEKSVTETSLSTPLVQHLSGNGNSNVLPSQLPAIHSTSLSPFPLSSTFI